MCNDRNAQSKKFYFLTTSSTCFMDFMVTGEAQLSLGQLQFSPHVYVRLMWDFHLSLSIWPQLQNMTERLNGF